MTTINPRIIKKPSRNTESNKLPRGEHKLVLRRKSQRESKSRSSPGDLEMKVPKSNQNLRLTNISLELPRQTLKILPYLEDRHSRITLKTLTSSPLSHITPRHQPKTKSSTPILTIPFSTSVPLWNHVQRPRQLHASTIPAPLWTTATQPPGPIQLMMATAVPSRPA